MPIHEHVLTHNLGWRPMVQGVSLTRAPGSSCGTLLGPPYPGRYARQGCIAEGLTSRCRSPCRKAYLFQSIGSCVFNRKHVRMHAQCLNINTHVLTPSIAGRPSPGGINSRTVRWASCRRIYQNELTREECMILAQSILLCQYLERPLCNRLHEECQRRSNESE